MSVGPDFIGIGAQKCATTFVYELLLLHPGVRFPASPDRWDPPPARLDGRLMRNSPKEMRFLHGRNANLSWDEYLGVFVDKAPGVVYGEITPAYLLATRRRIEELRARVPDVRLFVILRDPVERDWSSIRMVAERQNVLGDEAALRTIADSPAVGPRGDYGLHLARWLAVFPREQLLVLLYEQLALDRTSFLTALCEHLGVPVGPIADAPDRVVFAGPKVPFPDDLRMHLTARYRGVTERLEQLTGIDFGRYWSPALHPEAR